MKRLLLSAFLGSIAVSNAWAAPAEVIIIRHAEKPAMGQNLSPRGEERAQALVKFFQEDPRVLQFALPVAIYATDPKDVDSSLRPIETVTPLAQALGLTLRTDFRKKEVSQVAQEILNSPEYDGRMVLICWEHDDIPSIAMALGVSSAPTWSGEIFDRFWKIDFDQDGHVIRFENLPQRLLPGDDPN